MMMALFLSELAGLAGAQFPPGREGITWVRSQHHAGVTISYKNPHLCVTTPGVQSYAGYVHLPPGAVDAAQDYPINTFFWFVEARNKNKSENNPPLSIWLNGGPGASSLLGMLSENGPCRVLADSNATAPNPWAWNNEAHVLFLDQPVQVGFSYDALFNGTYDLLQSDAMESETSPIRLVDFGDDENGGVPEQNATFYVGTFASQNATRAPNSTAHAAVALWHFAQTWFEEFPEYKPHDEKVSLWAESYGGHYGPAFMDFFQQQNEKISRGEIAGPGTHYLHLDTLGIINGCVDELVQSEAYSFMAWNNTYGVAGVNETTKHRQLYELRRPDGILDRIRECQRLDRLLLQEDAGAGEGGEKTTDPAFVESYCRNASAYASDLLVAPYLESGQHGWFDVTHPAADPFPTNYHIGWLNQHWVQKALGAPLNFTWVSPVVSDSFQAHGDMARGGYLEALADLLDHGVKVHLVYGDRDFACNWIGGEAVSLAIPHKYQNDFAAAGYTDLTVSGPEAPPFAALGLTRQHGNLSFTRVFQAGHMVPSYQPEASLRVFERALFNRDIATGAVDLTTTGGWWSGSGDDEPEGGQVRPVFATSGTRDTWWRRNEVLPPLPPAARRCYILNLMTCSQDDVRALREGRAIVKDYVIVGVTGPPEREGGGDGDDEAKGHGGGEGQEEEGQEEEGQEEEGQEEEGQEEEGQEEEGQEEEGQEEEEVVLAVDEL